MAAATPTPTHLNYLIVRPEKAGVRDLMRYALVGDHHSFSNFMDITGATNNNIHDDEDSGAAMVGPTHAHAHAHTRDERWIIVVSIVVCKIIAFFAKPLEWTGCFVDFLLNLLSHNGYFFGLLRNFIRGEVVVPQRGTETFMSTIGQLDGRTDLHRGWGRGEALKPELGNRALMDLCIMASKLAYENDQVIKNVVNRHWRMHFVDFYNCWNDFQKVMSTQVFILCDKAKDANLILVGFRGTEPFDADDWCTDFDYSWYEIPKVGKVHTGFLEALGLGNRAEPATFHYHLQGKNRNRNRKFSSSNDVNIGAYSSKLKDSESLFTGKGSDSDVDQSECGQSSNSETHPEKTEMTAYYTVRSKLKSLLEEHKNAKFIVTGHSLGGALAIMFPTVLVVHEETEIMERLLGVYTFGQPRIGNRELGRFMEAHLERPVPKYFRVVYCNDLVPRLPSDNKTFLYKHFGVCLYYNSLYIEKKVKEEPNGNCFGIRFVLQGHLNAIWELIRGLTIGYVEGAEYKEGWFRILARIVGLALPGISAHCPTDYINSIRLGKESSIQISSI